MLCCRVEACLPHCQRFAVNDAQAYLLERVGDIPAAVKLYVEDICSRNAALIHGVLQGNVQLLNVATKSGQYASLLSIRHVHVFMPRLSSRSVIVYACIMQHATCCCITASPHC